MITRQQVVERILSTRPTRPNPVGVAFSPANIALCKYWGKRNSELNLPVTSSLSVSLNHLGTTTEIAPDNERDRIFLNDRPLPADDPFVSRFTQFLNLFRNRICPFFSIRTSNSIPTSAGLASSASGFAAAAAALDRLFGWDLDSRQLSILARLGSGSACRSVIHGFIEWRAGENDDGMDSYAIPLPDQWPELRIAIVTVADTKKPISSRAAMLRTVETSALYREWPRQSESDLTILRQAIASRDFELLGRTSESNALAMHATMMAAWPPVVYWLPETITAMNSVWRLRNADVPVYFTIDAGPNLKLLFLESETDAIAAQFPNAIIVAPWSA